MWVFLSTFLNKKKKKNSVGKCSLQDAPFLFTNLKSDTPIYSSLALAYFSNILFTQYFA